MPIVPASPLPGHRASPVDDGGESDASGGTVDLDSQELGSQEPESQEPDSLLPDHIQLSNAAFAPSGSGDLHNLLAKHNVDIDSCDQAGYTTLMSMIKHKRRDSALVLLKNGAGVLFVNSQGWSAFHLAASTGDIEVLHSAAQCNDSRTIAMAPKWNASCCLSVLPRHQISSKNPKRQNLSEEDPFENYESCR